MAGSRYDASTKAKAVRLVREHAGDYPTEPGIGQFPDLTHVVHRSCGG